MPYHFPIWIQSNEVKNNEVKNTGKGYSGNVQQSVKVGASKNLSFDHVEVSHIIKEASIMDGNKEMKTRSFETLVNGCVVALTIVNMKTREVIHSWSISAKHNHTIGQLEG